MSAGANTILGMVLGAVVGWLRRGDGTLDQLFGQWIMGKAGSGSSPQPPALVELLHWMER